MKMVVVAGTGSSSKGWRGKDACSNAVSGSKVFLCSVTTASTLHRDSIHLR